MGTATNCNTRGMATKAKIDVAEANPRPMRI
jgi:hypothetical protein